MTAVHGLVLVHVAHWKTTGRTCTPLEPSESMQTLEFGYVNAGFVLFTAAIVLTLVFGRFFCGWACHVVAYQDACRWLLEKLGFRPRPVRVRLLRLAPFAAAAYMFLWPTVERWWSGGAAPSLTARFTTSAFWQTFPGPWMAALTFAVDGALVVWWFGAKGFCTYGCPYGAIFGLADRASIGRIVVSDACEGCGHCTAVCTSNVRVHEEVATFGRVVDANCMKCLDCVRSCPKEALSFGFAKPSWRGAVAKACEAWSSDRADLTWGEEGLALVVGFGAFLVFRGLYGKVPFLLAIGLATVAAIAAITLARAFRRRDFGVQSTTWKHAGRWTRPGVAIGVGALLFLVFATHSAVVQWFAHRGEASYQAWERDLRDHDAATRAESSLTRATELGLFPDASAESRLAALCRQSGRAEAALGHLRRALAVDRTAVNLAGLSTVLLDLGRPSDARDALQEAVELEPQNAVLRRRLAQLGGAAR